jgi:hypothetical protein
MLSILLTDFINAAFLELFPPHCQSLSWTNFGGYMTKLENWTNVSSGIRSRWGICEDEIIQASGIDELAGFISKKYGEPRSNVLHELVNLVREQDPESPLVDEYISDSRAYRGDEETENRI